MNEAWRAVKLREMAEKEWRGRIDGFIRMELGFEIIHYSFEHGLDVKRIMEAEGGGMGGPPAVLGRDRAKLAVRSPLPRAGPALGKR